MQEPEKFDGDKINLIKHIYESNQQITHLADTKVSALQLINTLIISFSATYGLRSFPIESKMVLILAVVLAALSSLTLLVTILPRFSKKPSRGFVFYQGICAHGKEEYWARMAEVTKEELMKDYVDSIYTLALIQQKKYLRLRVGLISSFLAISLVGLSIILNALIYPG